MTTVNSFPLETTPFATALQTANLALYKATSTSSLAIGTGNKVFTTQEGKDFVAGDFVLASSDADPSTDYMSGVVVSYVDDALTVDVLYVGGSGTHADWTIRASGPPGPTGAPGPTGPPGANGEMTGPGASVDGEIALYDGAGGETLKRMTGSGLVKVASGVASVAVSGTDYAPATSGSAILKGSGSGGFSSATPGTDFVRADTASNLTAGFTGTSYGNGTVSSGTLTPAAINGGHQHYTNNGAHTLAPPSPGAGLACSIVLDQTNGASAGAVTRSGFTKTTGDTLTTTNGHKFRHFITVGNGGSHCHSVALQ